GRSPAEVAAQQRQLDQARAAREREQNAAQQQFDSREREITAQEATERRQDSEQRAQTATQDLNASRTQLRGGREVDEGAMRQAAEQLWYAMHGGTGWGTDEDKIRQVLAGKTPEEIEAIRRAYAAQNNGKDLMRELESELSGDDLRA